MPSGKKVPMPLGQTVPSLGMCLQTFSKVNFKDGRCSTAATSHGLERANVHQEGPD